MSRAITNLTRIGLIDEVTAGTTPATPAMQTIRATSESFSVERQFTHSEEFNVASQVADQILIANRATGGFGCEWADGEVGIETILQSCLCGTWATDVLLAGITPKPPSIEVKYEAGTNDQYKIFTGMYGNELSLDFNAGSKITGSAAFMGMSSTYAAAGVTGGTYPAFGTEPVNTTCDMLLTSTGLVVDSVTKLTMKLNNSARAHQCLTSASPSAIARGTLQLGGDIELYLNTGVADWATKFLANSSFTLLATAGNTTIKKTTFEIPKAKFKNLTVVAQANDQDLMVRGQWEGFYDSTVGSALRVTRNVA